MKWIKSYRLFENKNKVEIKASLKECVDRIGYLFKYLSTNIVDSVDLKNYAPHRDEEDITDYAPAIMFNNKIQSPVNDLDIDDTIFNILAICMFGKCNGLQFTDKNGIFIENKFIAYPEDWTFKISLTKASKRVYPVPDTKEEILFTAIQNYAKLMEMHQTDNVMYNDFRGVKVMARTVLYRNIIIDYCYYLMNNHKNGMNLFTVDSNEILNGLCYITYNHLSKNPSGYKYLFEIQNRYPKFYSKLETIFGDDINRASSLGDMGFADDN